MLPGSVGEKRRMLTPDIFTCACLAVTAWVFSEYLTRPGMIFSFWGNLLERLHQAGNDWLAKPLGWCSICFSGQLALWHYIFRAKQYAVDEAVFFVSGAIFFTIAIQSFHERNNA